MAASLDRATDNRRAGMGTEPSALPRGSRRCGRIAWLAALAQHDEVETRRYTAPGSNIDAFQFGGTKIYTGTYPTGKLIATGTLAVELPDKITPGTPFQIGPNAPCPCGSGRKPRPPASVTVIHAFRSFSDMPEVIHPPSTPRTWGGWEAPAPVIAGVFDAAAAYHRAAPWTLIDDRLALYVRTERGTTWSPIVMGGGDAVFGVAMPETLGPCLAARPGAEPEAVLVELRVVARPASPPRRRR